MWTWSESWQCENKNLIFNLWSFKTKAFTIRQKSLFMKTRNKYCKHSWCKIIQFVSSVNNRLILCPNATSEEYYNIRNAWMSKKVCTHNFDVRTSLVIDSLLERFGGESQAPKVWRADLVKFLIKNIDVRHCII